ncbi:hypothetical protein [Actinopolymorpha rutila]|uniref:ATP-dependent DNA ligase n=1 Tax=Actinopolymorpha rutila TaxID=446787 RepID=UPI00307CDEE6
MRWPQSGTTRRYWCIHAAAPLGPAFPEIVGALYAYLPTGTVVDGEIVCWRGGRLDFAALQHRYARQHQAAELATTDACHLVVFDVLETARDGDLRRRPLKVRRVVLERLFARVPARSPLTLALHTADPVVAQEWYETMAVAGVEGLVIKPADSLYVSGSREWLKYKARQTTDAIVGGITGSLHRPETLLLGRYASDTGRLHYAGRTTRLTDGQAAAVAPLLAAPTDGHPWPAQLSTNWRSKPTDYLQVAPNVGGDPRRHRHRRQTPLAPRRPRAPGPRHRPRRGAPRPGPGGLTRCG